MGRRWLRVATEAHCLGALDFSKIRRDDIRSLVKEHLVLDHLERKFMGDLFTFETGRVQTGASFRSPLDVHNTMEQIGKAYRRNVIPWMQVYIDDVKAEKEKRKVDLTNPEQVESYFAAMIANTRRPNKEKNTDG